MRILVIDTCFAMPVIMRLGQEQNEVKVFIPEGEAHPSAEKELFGKGIYEEYGIERVHDVLRYYDWADIILYTDINFGKEIDTLISRGYKVFGAPYFVEEMENDREYIRKIYPFLNYPETYHFDSVQEAIDFFGENKGIYVIKVDKIGDSSIKTYVPFSEEDCRDHLEYLLQKVPDASLILQKKIDGVEIAITGFYNGTKFLKPYLINYEEKRMFPGNIGPFTGEMGTTGYFEYESKLFDETLRKIEHELSRTRFHGVFDFNCIVDEEGNTYILEPTPRFGAPTMSLYLLLIKDEFSKLVYNVTYGIDEDIDVYDNIGVTVGYNACGYPFMDVVNQRGANKVVYVKENEDINIDFYGVYKDDDGKLRVVPNNGRILTVSGKHEKFDEVYRIVYDYLKDDCVYTIDGYYRNDIGIRLKEQKDILFNTGYMDILRYNNI